MNKLLKDGRVVERRQIFFYIWSGFIALGLVMAIIFSIIDGTPFNLTTNYTGGYSISVRLGSQLDEDNFVNYAKEIESIIENTKKDDKSVVVTQTTRYGEYDTAGIRFIYHSIGDEQFMDDLGDSIVEAINNRYFANDWYLGKVTNDGLSSSTITSTTIFTTILALMLAVVLIIIYVSFRFNFVTGLSSVLVMLLDLAVMFAFVAITRIEIDTNFIMALMAIAMYSLNNSLVVFDRVRETNKDKDNAHLTANATTNLGVRNSFARSMGALTVSAIAIVLPLAIGVPNLRLFLIPLLFGVLSSTFSSILVATSLYTMVAVRHPDLMQGHAFSRSIANVFKNIFRKREKISKEKKIKKDKRAKVMAN